MNEQIKKLIEQAGIESYSAKLLVNTDEEGKVSSKWEIPLEKFAELIVQECAAEADRCAAEADKYAERGSWMAGYRIKQHFGVEE